MNMAREVIIRIIGETQGEPSPDGSSENNPKADGKKEKKSTEQILAAYLGKKIVTAIKDESLYYVGKYFDATEN